MRALRILPITAYLISGIAVAGPLEVLSVRASLSGSFTQSIVSPDGVELERAEGQFRLLRPHFFWWEIEQPDRQLLVAVDGQLTQIDWDLEVVSRRDFSPEDRTVLQWLLASREELDAAFILETQDQAVSLTAYDPNAPIPRLSIEYLPETPLWRLALTDRAGQIINLTLTEDVDRRLSHIDFAIPSTYFD